MGVTYSVSVSAAITLASTEAWPSALILHELKDLTPTLAGRPAEQVVLAAPRVARSGYNLGDFEAASCRRFDLVDDFQDEAFKEAEKR